MKCPHCLIAFHEAWRLIGEEGIQGKTTDDRRIVPFRKATANLTVCPTCHGMVVKLLIKSEQPNNLRLEEIILFPRNVTRPVPPEVPEKFNQDFKEAAAVLSDSPKASAAISRRCLQMILRDEAKVKQDDLFSEIEEFINSGRAPTDIQDSLHMVRQIGNFAAHPIKSKNTGEIVEVEEGEAEWNLDVLERLFDYFFVGPAITAKRKVELNKKLVEAGKQPIP